LGPVLWDFVGKPCLISEIVGPARWVRIDFAGGFSYKLEENTRFRIGPLPADDGIGQQLATFSAPAQGLAAGFQEETLEHLAEQVEKRRRQRFRKGKADGDLAELRDILVEASSLARLRRRPRPAAGVLRLYESLDAGVPLQVRFADGTRGTDISVGAEFMLLEETPAGNYYVEDSTGARVPMPLLARAWAVFDAEAELAQESETTSDGGIR
jgi:hypothetical protein